MKQSIIIIAVAAIGVVGGAFVGRSLQARANEQAIKDAKADQAAEFNAKFAKANKRISDLERQLADANSRAKKAESDAKSKAKTALEELKDKAEKTVVKLGAGEDMASQLKKQLPAEQFSQVTNAFAQFRAKLAKRAKGRQDYLASIDTSNMTAKEKENHQRYLELFAKREAAAAKMKGGIPNQESIQEMVMIGMEMGPVAKQERETLMRQVTSELGYTGDDAAVITDTIKNVYDCTNASPLGGLNDMLESAGSMGGMGGGAAPVKVQTQVIGL